MGGLAPEPGGVCFVQGPPALGVVRCVRDEELLSNFGSIVFFSERAFTIATKVP